MAEMRCQMQIGGTFTASTTNISELTLNRGTENNSTNVNVAPI